MQTYRLRHRDHTTLFEGEYRSTRECVEAALRQGIGLNGASFANLDLSEVNLDGCRLREVDFSGTNLSGANISEAELIQCDFTNASLFNVCFAYSDLSGSIFSYAGLGGADISASILNDCHFAGASSLTLPFHLCANQKGAVFEILSRHCEISFPPLVISGLGNPVALFDNSALIDGTIFSTKNEIWLQDNHNSALQKSSTPPADLHKAMMTLQRVKRAYVDTQIVARKKSTES